MTVIVQPKDSRGYFMLPQAPADAGYYVYGDPGGGVVQFAEPRILSLIFAVEREWQAIEKRKFGVGDISAAGGPKRKDHRSHTSGLEVDVRPMRKDGKHLGCRYQDPAYDRAATEMLISIFRSVASEPLCIFFNDTKISGVRPLIKHDNHFHVQFA